MNWKNEAVGKLRDYAAKRLALVTIPEQIQQLKAMSVSQRGTQTDKAPVKGGDTTQEDVLLSNIVRRQELGKALKEARTWVKTVDKGLAVLTADERRLLELLYISPAKGNADLLCQEFQVEKTALYYRRDKALRRFTLAVYGCLET